MVHSPALSEATALDDNAMINMKCIIPALMDLFLFKEYLIIIYTFWSHAV